MSGSKFRQFVLTCSLRRVNIRLLYFTLHYIAYISFVILIIGLFYTTFWKKYCFFFIEQTRNKIFSRKSWLLLKANERSKCGKTYFRNATLETDVNTNEWWNSYIRPVNSTKIQRSLQVKANRWTRSNACKCWMLALTTMVFASDTINEIHNSRVINTLSFGVQANLRIK